MDGSLLACLLFGAFWGICVKFTSFILGASLGFLGLNFGFLRSSVFIPCVFIMRGFKKICNKIEDKISLLTTITLLLPFL